MTIRSSIMTTRMDGSIKRVTANLPADLLQTAQNLTGKGSTETLVEGLSLLRRSRAYEKAMALKDKLNIAVDLDIVRERSRR